MHYRCCSSTVHLAHDEMCRIEIGTDSEQERGARRNGTFRPERVLAAPLLCGEATCAETAVYPPSGRSICVRQHTILQRLLIGLRLQKSIN